MRIRKMKKRDINKVYNLGLEQFKGEEWYDKKFLFDTIKRRGINYVAIYDAKIVGVIMVAIYDKPKAWIFFFVVDKKHRRRGIGNDLLNKIEKNLPNGYFLLLVDFDKKIDYIAKKFYKKHKFKKLAEIKNWFGRGNSGLIYGKTLKS